MSAGPAGGRPWREGPAAQALADRIARCPDDFLRSPQLGSAGEVVVAAVVSDVLVMLGGEPLDAVGAARWGSREASPAAAARLGCVLVACWLLADEALRAAGAGAEAAAAFLATGLDELADLVPARSLVSDPDRRAELARRALQAFGLRPAGESEADAADRLAALDSVLRAGVLAGTRAAARRAEEVREAMRAQAAAEAAARVMPE